MSSHPAVPAAFAPSPPARPVPLARIGGAAVGLALFAAAMWFAWLGWDHEYHLVDGVEQGPYRAWQVVGCGLAIAAASVVAYLWARSGWAIFVLSAAGVIGFAVPWTADAAMNDESGLFVVGLMFLLVGGGLGLTLVLGLTRAAMSVRDARARRR